MSQPAEWDEEIDLIVTVRVNARPNPEYFEGWLDRTPLGAAINAVWVGRDDLGNIDGYADLIGDARIIAVEEF